MDFVHMAVCLLQKFIALNFYNLDVAYQFVKAIQSAQVML